MHDVGRAYKKACNIVRSTKESGSKELNLAHDDLRHLMYLPLEIEELEGVVFIDISNTQVADISSLAHLKRLQSVNLSGTKVASIEPLKSLTDLRYLDANGSGLESLPTFSSQSSIRRISVAGTKINELPDLSGLPDLVELDASDTPLQNISGLKGVKSLRRLDLARTSVEDISPVQSLESLEFLDISYSPIVELRPMLSLALKLVGKAEDAERRRKEAASKEDAVPADFEGLKIGFDFVGTEATLVDRELDRLAKLSKDRTQETMQYLASLDEDWPKIDSNIPKQDRLFPVKVFSDKIDLDSEVEQKEEPSDLEKSLHKELKRLSADLQVLAGNRFSRLLDISRDLSGLLNEETNDLDLSRVHIAIEATRCYLEVAQGSDDDEFGVDLLANLQQIQTVGPSLTLGDETVQLIEERKQRFRSNFSSPAGENFDKLMEATSQNFELFGNDIRQLSAALSNAGSFKSERMRAAEIALSRNIVVVAGGAVVGGILSGFLGELGASSAKFLVANKASVAIIGQYYGEAFMSWIMPVLAHAQDICRISTAKLSDRQGY